jgi:hypothetical protein
VRVTRTEIIRWPFTMESDRAESRCPNSAKWHLWTTQSLWQRRVLLQWILANCQWQSSKFYSVDLMSDF